MPLGQGVLGALGGFAAGGPVGAAIGGLSGLLGLGQQHEDPALRQMRQQQQGIANRLMQYGTSVPGSSPDELANMAQARGVLGQEQRATQQRVLGAYNPQQGLPVAQMMANLGNTFTAQQMAQHAQFLQDSGAARRQALMNAASIGQGAAGLYRPQQSQFPQVAGQLAQMLAYQQARQKGQPSPSGTEAGTSGTGTGVDMNTGWNPDAGTPGVTAQYPGNTSAAPSTEADLGPDWWQMFKQFQQQQGGGELVPLSLNMGNVGTGQPSAAVQGINAQTGQNAPGQAINGMNNQIRQSNGFSTPFPGVPGGPNMMLLGALARQLFGGAG